jgi:hypothetical protein
MNVGIGTVAGQFLFWEYMFRIVGIVSLQCEAQRSQISMSSFGRRAMARYFWPPKDILANTNCCGRSSASSGQQRAQTAVGYPRHSVANKEGHHLSTNIHILRKKAAFDKNLVSWFLNAR